MLDQQPIRAFTPGAIVAHAHQNPTAVQLFSVQREFQIALLESALRIVGLPIAAVPELHGPAAILGFWNRAFEIAIIERMIFNFHRQALIVRIERRPLGNRPGFENAAELQPEIIMQPARCVLLDDKPPLP